MITDMVLCLVLKIVSPLIALLKPINVIVNTGFITIVLDIVSGILYFLPVDVINTILGITLATWIFRMVVSFLRTLWGILPFI